MLNVPKSTFIRGNPIKTPIGKCYFIKISEQDEFYRYQQLLFFTKEKLYSEIEDILSITKDKLIDEIRPVIDPQYIGILSSMEMIDIIKSIKELGYYDVFKGIYEYFLGVHFFDSLINDKDLLIYRIQIMGKIEKLLYDEEDEGDKDIKVIKKNKDESNALFFDMIKNIKELKINSIFNELFNLCFKDEKDSFNKITKYDDFQEYLQLIIDMNCAKEEIPENPNPEIEKFNRYERMLEKAKKGNITYESIYTSLWVALKQQPENLTIYQFNKLFNRIAHFEAFKVTSNGNYKKIDMWYEDDENETEDVNDEEIDKANEKALENIGKVVVDI